MPHFSLMEITEQYLEIVDFEQIQCQMGLCVICMCGIKREHVFSKRENNGSCKDCLVVHQNNVIFLKSPLLAFSSPAIRCSHSTEFQRMGRGLHVWTLVMRALMTNFPSLSATCSWKHNPPSPFKLMFLRWQSQPKSPSLATNKTW